MAASGGADFGKYLDWCRVFVKGDISTLARGTLTPMKVPLSQWSFGSGLIFSVGSYFFKSHTAGALSVGWVFNAVFWWAFIGILSYVAKQKTDLVLLGICIAFLGSPLGFYSSVYSSESLSYACLAVMGYWVLTKEHLSVIDCFLVGCLASLLIMIRSQLLIYDFAVFAMLSRSIVTSMRQRGTTRHAVLKRFAAVSFPIFVGCVAVAIVNRWMTGSFFGSTYDFGGNTFKSMDFKKPEIAAVLVHSWHGLFSYHPLLFVEFLTLVGLIAKLRFRYEKALVSLLVCIILAHVYVHASWYCWWLGTGTFGMRGLGIATIVLVPALIYYMSDESSFTSSLWFYLLILLGCCWSYPLLLQGCTNFYTHGQLVEHGATKIAMLFASRFSLYLMLVVVIGGLTRPIETKLPTYKYFSCLILFYLVVFYQLSVMDTELGSEVLISIELATVICVPFFVSQVVDINLTKNRLALVDRPVAYFFISVFCFCLFRFIILALNTETNIACGKIQYPTSNLDEVKYISSINISEVEASYNEYLNVPGFSGKKAALAGYIAQMKNNVRNASAISGEEFKRRK